MTTQVTCITCELPMPLNEMAILTNFITLLKVIKVTIFYKTVVISITYWSVYLLKYKGHFDKKWNIYKWRYFNNFFRPYVKYNYIHLVFVTLYKYIKYIQIY